MRELRFTKKFRRFFPPSQFSGNPWVQRIVALNFLLLFFQTGSTLFFQNSLPPLLPLFYSQSWGRKQLASRPTLFLLPFLSTLIFSLNLLLAYFLYEKEKILSLSSLFLSTIFIFLLLLTEIKIIFLFQ